MKNRFNLSVFLMILAFLAFGSVMAQDDRLPVPDLDSGIKETTYPEVYPEGENKIVRPVMVNRDSIQLKPVVPRKDKENASVLSFNFLYYLIERYKLSDIVD